MRVIFSLVVFTSLVIGTLSRELADIYEGCGDTKTCWGYFEAESRDCDWTVEDCDMFVSWMENGDDTMTFEVQSIDPHMPEDEIDVTVHYISVAFSRDAEYSDDTSIMCSLGFEPNTRLYQAVSWLPVYVGDDEGLDTVLIEGGIGFAYASFIRPVSITYDAPTGQGATVEEVNDLSAEPFYIMTAFGPLNPFGGIGEDVMAAASQESYMFTESGQAGSTSEGPMTTILSPSYIMEGCGETKTCWGHNEAEDRDCDWETEECELFVTWMDNGDDTMTFEVQSIDPHMSEDPIDASVHWISVTFSRDDVHANDTSIICSTGFEPNTRLYHSVEWLPIYVGNDEGLETIDIVGGVGFIYASFVRPVSMSYLAPTLNDPMDEVNDLSAEPFYVMAALGPLTANGGIGEDVIAAVSDEPYILAESSGSEDQETTTSSSPLSSRVSAVNIVSGLFFALYAMLH